ncbi:MAG: hypothetical protein H0V44_16875 [Planctomycetes bacterium]|nr:hypothetical protein [Planctomycetota bacterium]
MNTTDAQQLKLSIIQALELAPDGQNLDSIHETIHRARRDLTVLPQISALVTGGLIEKVAHPADADTANRPVANARRVTPRPAHSVRFRLTSDGRSLLASARDNGQVPPLAAVVTGHKTFVDYDDRVVEDDRG